jgi:uroporphyrinogen-III synthase
VLDDTKAIPGNPDEYNCIAFTSVNAVNAFNMILRKGGIRLNKEVKFCAVGPSTAFAAENAFRKPDIVPENNNAVSLAEAIIENIEHPGKLKALWPCGKEALPDFEEVLSEAGANVNRFECYLTEALDPGDIKSDLRKVAPWDLAFFAAPGAVKAFSITWEDKSGFIAAAIGPTTEKALINEGYENIVTSKGTSVTDCAGAIIDALQIEVWS